MESQEKFVIDYYSSKNGLFFVDVGANDGLTYSNTVNLERKYGWKGICIEANKDCFDKLIKNRSSICVNSALYSEEAEKIFYKIDGYSEMLSGLEDSYSDVHKKRIEKEVQDYNQKLQKIQVKTKRLDSILKENLVDTVAYMSIDTEGSELDILKGINLKEIFVKLISVEDNYDEKIVNEYLSKFGYREIARCGLDNFFEKI